MSQQPVDIITSRVIAKLQNDLPTGKVAAASPVDIDKMIADTMQSVTADVQTIMEGGTPAYTERPNSDNNINIAYTEALNELEYNKRVQGTSYFKNLQERRPATPQQANVVGNEARQATKPTAKKAKAVENPKTDRQSNAENIGIPYRFTSVDAEGNKVNFTAKLAHGTFKLLPDELERDNTPKNINTIKKYVTRMVFETVGGWDRVNSIKAKTGYLVVNNMMIVPQSQQHYDKNKIPFDVYDYLKEGAIAYLFNWNMLTKMNNLLSIDIDTVDFYLSEICTDLGYGRTGGYKTIFLTVKSLNVLKIGDNILTRDDVFNVKGAGAYSNIDNLSDNLSVEKRGLNIMDGYTINVYSNTSALESWSWSNLRNYAKNRGNKGILRYSIGCVSRLLLSSGSSVINAGAHLLGGTFKVLKQALKDGMTPISNE